MRTPWRNSFPAGRTEFPLQPPLPAPAAATVAVLSAWYWFSPEYTDVGYAPEQPVAFSHKLHAGDLGLDCRYCHNTVERGARAAVPPTQTCMNCHGIVLADSPKLALVRTSFESNEPIGWVRVHMLPDYAYFDHSVHVAAGVGCASCHGRIDQMNTVHQSKPLSMSWCLDCHRNPAPQLRPRSEVTNMKWDELGKPYDPANDPFRTRQPAPPTHCSGCHR